MFLVLPARDLSMLLAQTTADPDPSPDIAAGKAFLQGALFSSTAYGVELVLSVASFYHFSQRVRRSPEGPRTSLLFLVFIFAVFALDTVFMVGNCAFTQTAFAENPGFPGGPGAYAATNNWTAGNTYTKLSSCVANWLMDLLLVWRCMVIYRGCSGPASWLVRSLTLLLFAASFTMGVLTLAATAHASAWAAGAGFALAYNGVTLALNVLITLFIAARILACRRRAARVLGAAAHAARYTGAAALLVESAALYSLFLALFIATFARGSPLAAFFVQAVNSVQAIAAFLIIFRVAHGRGWTATTGEELSVRCTRDAPLRLPAMRFAAADDDACASRVSVDAAKPPGVASVLGDAAQELSAV